MDLSTIDPAIIDARGRYATVNGEYKTAMSTFQSLTQTACDDLRHALQDDVNRKHHLEHAGKMLESIGSLSDVIDELKAQKDALYPQAWGKK